MKRFLILVMFACVGLMGAAQHVIVDGGSPNSPFPAATTTSTPTNTPTAGSETYANSADLHELCVRFKLSRDL